MTTLAEYTSAVATLEASPLESATWASARALKPVLEGELQQRLTRAMSPSDEATAKIVDDQWRAVIARCDRLVRN